MRLPDALLVPDHDLIERIGRGGYGEVWLARNRTTRTLRAVKIVSRDEFEDERPYQREFEGLLKFEPISRSHPSQLAILHVGRNDEAGCFYYVMELADPAESKTSDQSSVISNQSQSSPRARDSVTQLTGDHCSLITDYSPKTLRSEIKTRGRLPAAEVIELGRALTTALAHLHSHGLVHRDIKPANIVYVGGVPKLADIGLVTDASDACSMVGTEGYIPPEGPGSPQADLYSLGKVLYEAATGRDRRDYPALPDDLRSWLDAKLLTELNAVILRACAPRPRERYQSADVMRADLELLNAGRSVKRRQAWQQARRGAVRLGAAAAVILGAWFLFHRVSDSTLQRSTASMPASIFVLPFRNDGTNQVDELLRSRVTDAIIDGLAQIDGIKVTPRQSPVRYRDEDEVLREIGGKFQVRYVLSGRMLNSTGTMSVRVNLFDTQKAQPLLLDVQQGARERLLELEKRIIEKVAASLGIEVSPSAREAIETKVANNVAAYEAFKATPYGYAATKEEADATLAALNRATELDPNFVEAHLRLAHHYRLRSDVSLAPKVAAALELKAVRKALQVDPTSAEALTRLAGVQTYYDWDWPEAERNLKRSLQLSHSDPNGNYACLLETLGRWDEAFRIWKALEGQAPTSDFVLTGLYVNHFLQRRYDEAIAVAQKGIDVNPKVSVWYWMLGRCHHQLGDYVKAEQLIRKAQSIDNEPLLVGFIGNLYAVMGKTNEARAELLRLEEIAHHRYLPAAFRAFIHVGLGETNQAFVCLDQAYQDRSETLVFSQSWPLKYDPIWDPLRSDPRYTNLLRRVNLEP